MLALGSARRRQEQCLLLSSDASVCVIGLAASCCLCQLGGPVERAPQCSARSFFSASCFPWGGVGFSAYLTYPEIYVIEALCAWCVASAAIITLLFVKNAIAHGGQSGRQ